MLKQLILKNWKTFRNAVLPIDPLTVLIGTNASGKSNALDALEFLKRTVRGKEIQAALSGDSSLTSIRGGGEWAALKPETQFTLEALVAGEDDSTDYLYSITVQTKPIAKLYHESLVRLQYQQKKQAQPVRLQLLETYISSSESPGVITQFYGSENGMGLAGLPGLWIRSYSILSQLKGYYLLDETVKGISTVRQSLENIFILNSIPSIMRDYSLLSDNLESDASNIAGVLAALPDERKAEVESTLSTYVKHLPERDIQRVWAEPVGRFKTDAMLYCEELWKPGETTEIDARGMSDGTLRFLAILTALLTRPEGSQLVIEEVDNGLHPSRADLLLKMLREIGEKRKIDILVTTHNPALLDALGPEMVPFVVVAHRDTETGESKLTLLEDIDNLPKLMASGPLGKLTTKGAIERSLSGTN
ncbi:AAA family ATPase [Coleofasciculus sp. FACHB-64]|uniref:AAA family ATPase n=1 Tax=Cyanophyceae TaxID=3028117 RepID=UPI001686B298|nr:ATP-binding protein [Coleofasciculus sp. FACHB-64]MBD2046885.1 AAA family ATPase [Coleofasciculus sp. FACHB-64]